MLLLSRRCGEKVVIQLQDGRKVVVTVLECLGGRVRLGFDAPRDVEILREELLLPRQEART